MNIYREGGKFKEEERRKEGRKVLDGFGGKGCLGVMVLGEALQSTCNVM